MKTKEILNSHQIKPKKSYGQNFISDTNLIKKMVSLSGVDKSITVVEIGPGLGVLTKELALVAKQVVAFEIDPKLCEILQDTLKDYPNVMVINQDFLTVDLSDSLKAYQDEQLVVVANLPYYITTPILFKLFECDLPILRISVMMQKEVAERFTCEVGSRNYGAITIITQCSYLAKIVLKVGRNMFYPVPKVDSAVVLFVRSKRTKGNDQVAFYSFIKNSFKQPRKTLYNNLREFMADDLADHLINNQRLSPKIRPQLLSLMEYNDLFVEYEKKSAGEH